MNRKLLALGRKVACFLLIAFFQNPNADATAIVYVKYPGGYAVGADSLELNVDLQGRIISQSQICKLHVDHGIVFAASGYIGTKGQLNITDLSTPVRLQSNGDADSRNQALFKRVMSNSTFMAALEANPEPALTWVFIDANDAAEGIINYQLNRFMTDPHGFANAFGWPNHTSPYLQNLLKPYMKDNLIVSLPTRDEAIRFVRQSIQEGMLKDSWIIGGKISLLTVEKSKVVWINQGECANSSTVTPKKPSKE